MGLTLTTPPTSEPVSLGELKTALQVLHSADDAELTAIGKASRERVEKFTGRQLMQATYTMTLDAFPGGWCPIRLPRPPVQSVTSISYVDTDGTTQTLATSVYVLTNEQEPAIIELKYQQIWPIARNQPNAVTVVFVAGYTSADLVPFGLKQAIKMIARTIYDPEFVNAHQEKSAWKMAIESFLIADDIGEVY